CAASGQLNKAAVTPPSSVMNSRRPIIRSPCRRGQASRGPRLFWLNADRWNYFGPMVDLAGDEGGEFRRRTAHCVQTLKLHLGDNVRHFQHRHRERTELVDDRRWCACRRKEAIPADVDDARNGLVDRGCV